MKALLLEKPGTLQLSKVPTPEPGNDEVVLQVLGCALCRTDVRMWQHGHRDLLVPRVLGHEIVGTIDNQRFVIWPGVCCGNCRHCESGAENLCEQMRIIGFHRDGGLAEQVAVPETCLFPLPDDVPDTVACMAEPLACAFNGLELCGVGVGDRVLIYGAGRIGLLLALATSSLGAAPFLCEIDEIKLARSEAFRKELEIHSDTVVTQQDFDAVINAAASTETLTDGVPRLRAGGSFCLFSGLPRETRTPEGALYDLHYRQLHLVGAYGCAGRHIAAAVETLAEHHDILNELVEETIRLADVPTAMERMLTEPTFTFVAKP